MIKCLLPEPYELVDDLYIHQLEDKIYFSSSEGFFEYDPYKAGLVVSHAFDTILESGLVYKCIKQDSNFLYALSSDRIQVVTYDENGEYVSTKIYPFNDSQIDFVNFYEQISILHDGTVIIPNEKGFALLNDSSYQLPPGCLFINQVVSGRIPVIHYCILIRINLWRRIW